MIFVTGATGLLGSYLTRFLLAKGEKVRAFRRSSSDVSLLNDCADRVEWVHGDLLDISSLEDAMQGVKQVYHCAAVISFIASEVNHMMKVNIEGTANVMDAALAAGVEKLVHVSSVAAFGIAADDRVIDEKFSDPNINKTFWYYRSKQYGEREAWRAHAEGLNVVVVCPSTILGAGWWDDEPNALFRDIYKGLNFYTTATNGFVDVRDVVHCMYGLMQSPVSGEKYIISNENRTFKDLMWMMADAMQVKRPALEAGSFLRAVAWRTEWIKSLFTNKRPLVTKESAAVAAVNFQYSNEKIRKALSYEFIPLTKTISDTAQVFLQSNAQGKNWGVLPA